MERESEEQVQKMNLGRRTAEWVRMKYQRKSMFNLMADFDISESKAKRWLAGGSPTAADFAEMTELWGKSFLMYAFRDAIREHRRRRRQLLLERVRKLGRSARAAFFKKGT